MASYYYLMAQLPSIPVSGKPVLSYSAFKETACHFLSENDASLLQSISLEPPKNGYKTGSAFLDTWFDFERTLRYTLAQARASKLKWDYATPAIALSQFDIGQIARIAMSMENPLEAEAFLDENRLAMVRQLKPLNSFARDSVFAYAVELLLAERVAGFTVAQGKEAYKSLYKTILGEHYDRDER